MTGAAPCRLCSRFMAGLVAVTSGLTTLTHPAALIQISTNITDSAALIFPCAILNLNRPSPPASHRSGWNSLSLLENLAFFGFSFRNLVVAKATIRP